MAGFLVCAFSSILLCAQGPLWIGVCARFCTVVVVYWVKPQMMEFIFLCGCWFLGESPSQQAPGRKARGGGGGGGMLWVWFRPLQKPECPVDFWFSSPYEVNVFPAMPLSVKNKQNNAAT